MKKRVYKLSGAAARTGNLRKRRNKNINKIRCLANYKTRNSNNLYKRKSIIA